MVHNKNIKMDNEFWLIKSISGGDGVKKHLRVWELYFYV